MTNSGVDPVIEQQRGQIADLDRQLLSLLNQRIVLVSQLRAYKAALGLEFHDLTQEVRLLDALRAANPGPLSEAGLRHFFEGLLELVKREATRNP